MIEIFALLVASVAQQNSKQLELEDIDPDWVAENSPYGIDITMDGRFWLSLNPVGQKDDYGMLASDVHKASGGYATVWVRGYHKRNIGVAYRTSMTRYTYRCSAPQYKTIHTSYYNAAGEVTWSSDMQSAYQTIVPGTIAEYWRKVAYKLQTKFD